MESLKFIFCISDITVSYFKSERHEKLCLVGALAKGKISVLWMAAFLALVVARNKQVLLREKCRLYNGESGKVLRKGS